MGLVALAGVAATLLLLLAFSYRDSARCTAAIAQRHRAETALTHSASGGSERDEQQLELARQDVARYCR